MRLYQRVTQASVTVSGSVVGAISIKAIWFLLELDRTTLKPL